jgi:molecular chaperone HscB
MAARPVQPRRPPPPQASTSMSVQADHFERFDLPRRYELDRKALEAAYERLTLEHHPDFFSTAPEAERREAERVSAEVNEGYRVLRSDAARAAYLLGLLADGRALDTTALPAGFLQAMFALQEEVEALAEAGGGDAAAVDAARMAELHGQVQAELAAIGAERARLFAQAGEGPGPAPLERLQAIQSNLNCERYLQRLLERLEGRREDD